MVNTLRPYALVLLLAFLAYGPILWNGAGFSHPDDLAASQLGKCFTLDKPFYQECTFRPLLAATYYFNARFGGWMAVNFGLHLAASGLVLYLAGPLAACLFAVHPMAADAIASVSGRSALLLGVAVLLGLAIYRRSRLWGCIVGGVTALATVAFVPSYLGTIQGAPPQWAYVKQYASTLASQVVPKMVLSVGLNAEPVMTYAGVFSLLAILILIAALALMALPGLRLGIGLAILPMLPYFFLPLPNGFYEHRAYLSLAGISILAAMALKRIPRAAYLVIPAFIFMSESRAQVYSSPVALWEDAVAKGPLNGRARVNLCGTYATVGRWYEARAECETATRIAPDIQLGWHNLATLYVVRGQIGEASRVLDAFDESQKRKVGFQ